LIYFKLYVDYYDGAFESFLKPKNLIIVVIAWERATNTSKSLSRGLGMSK